MTGPTDATAANLAELAALDAECAHTDGWWLHGREPLLRECTFKCEACGKVGTAADLRGDRRA